MVQGSLKNKQQKQKYETICIYFMCCLESMAPYSYSVLMCCIWAKSQHTKKNSLKLLYKIFQGPMKVD